MSASFRNTEPSAVSVVKAKSTDSTQPNQGVSTTLGEAWPQPTLEPGLCHEPSCAAAPRAKDLSVTVQSPLEEFREELRKRGAPGLPKAKIREFAIELRDKAKFRRISYQDIDSAIEEFSVQDPNSDVESKIGCEPRISKKNLRSPFRNRKR